MMPDELGENSFGQSKDTYHIIGYSHMDMNWLWPFLETKNEEMLKTILKFPSNKTGINIPD